MPSFLDSHKDFVLKLKIQTAGKSNCIGAFVLTKFYLSLPPCDLWRDPKVTFQCDSNINKEKYALTLVLLSTAPVLGVQFRSYDGFENSVLKIANTY